MNLRIVIAGDQTLVSATLEPGVEIVARVRTGRAALTALVAHAPDVLVIGDELPDMTGPELVAVAERNHPATRVVSVAACARAGGVRRALERDVN